MISVNECFLKGNNNQTVCQLITSGPLKDWYSHEENGNGYMQLSSAVITRPNSTLILQAVLKINIYKMSLKITHVKLLSHLLVTCDFNSFANDKNVHYFADEILKCIFMNEKFDILIQISIMFVPMGPINNKSALVQVMAWRRAGDNSLPEPM